MTDSPLLALDRATKRYPRLRDRPAIDEATLRIDAGELVGVVGPSGSGKSTLLNLLGLLDRPTAGEVWFRGRNTDRLSDRRLSGERAFGIGFVFQQSTFLEGSTAERNVADGLLYQGVPSKERRRRARRALEQVGLHHRSEHLPAQLSGGEQQRVAVARAVVAQPWLVLADEPTGNLDSDSAGAMLSILRSLHEVGHTVVIVTHERELETTLPRVVSLHDGRILEDTARSRRRGRLP